MNDTVAFITDKRRALMTEDEMLFIEAHVGQFDTETGAAASLKIDRLTLIRLLLKRKANMQPTCSPTTAQIIRREIKKLGYKSE